MGLGSCELLGHVDSPSLRAVRRVRCGSSRASSASRGHLAQPGCAPRARRAEAAVDALDGAHLEPGRPPRSSAPAPGVAAGRAAPARRARAPQPSHTAWWCGSHVGVEARGAAARARATRAEPGRARARRACCRRWRSSSSGTPARRRSKRSCAVGCARSSANTRTMAMRCGVSLSPDARTHATISAARSPREGWAGLRRALVDLTPLVVIRKFIRCKS